VLLVPLLLLLLLLGLVLGRRTYKAGFQERRDSSDCGNEKDESDLSDH